MMIIFKYGYNRKREYLPQVNLLFIFSVENHLPVYYRMTPGNIREISAFRLCIEESGARDVVVIIENFYEKQYRLGTVSLISNCKPKSAEDIYQYYKSRSSIALQWYYKIYQILIVRKLLSRYSVGDILMHLSEIRKVKINAEWRSSEINKKTQKLIEQLAISIPIT